MITRTQIKASLFQPSFAIVGVSRHPQKSGNRIFRGLKSKGFQVIPVNPNIDKIDHACILMFTQPLKSTHRA